MVNNEILTYISSQNIEVIIYEATKIININATLKISTIILLTSKVPVITDFFLNWRKSKFQQRV